MKRLTIAVMTSGAVLVGEIHVEPDDTGEIDVMGINKAIDRGGVLHNPYVVVVLQASNPQGGMAFGQILRPFGVPMLSIPPNSVHSGVLEPTNELATLYASARSNLTLPGGRLHT